MSGKSEAASGTSRAARQIDSAACERADREALIEARHARKDATAIRRAQKSADWECGRVIAADDVEAPPPSAPTFIPGPVRNTTPNIASCDSSGCWDTSGGRYNRAAGNTFFGPNGVACTRTAVGIVCP